MTLKDIAKQLTTAVQTVPNLVQILRDGLEQATAGSTVEVTQVVSSGTKIASVKVDNETTDLYAPGAMHNYSTTEHVVGKWIDGTTDVYEKTIVYTPESAITGNATIADVTGLNIIRYTAVADNATNGNSFAIPLPVGTATTAIGKSGNNLILSMANETWSTDWTFTITIEYTKAA